MMGIKLKYSYDNFPAWAMSALMNGDTSGIEESDEKALDEFLAQYDDVVCWDYEPESLDHGNFKNYPLFGLATDCCTVHGYVESEVA